MLYKVTGRFTGDVWIVKDCECCGSPIEYQEYITRKVDLVINADYPDTAKHVAEEEIGFDEGTCEWDDGPYVDELPCDQALARIGAPALFATMAI